MTFFYDLSNKEIEDILHDIYTSYKEECREAAEEYARNRRSVKLREELRCVQRRFIDFEQVCEKLGLDFGEN